MTSQKKEIVQDEMSPAQDMILAILSVLLIVIAIMVGYEFVQNPHSPNHTPVLMIFGALCATVNWIYLFIIQKKKLAWIPSAAIGLLLWAMTYVAIFTQGNGHRKNHLPLSPACPKQVFLSSCGIPAEGESHLLRGVLDT